MLFYAGLEFDLVMVVMLLCNDSDKLMSLSFFCTKVYLCAFHLQNSHSLGLQSTAKYEVYIFHLFVRSNEFD